MDTHPTAYADLPFRQSLGTILHVIAVSMIFFMARSAMSPLLLDVERAFGVGHADSSGLMVLFTVGYGITMAVSGFVSRRMAHRRLIPFAAAVGATGTLVLSTAVSMAMMRVGLLLLGAGFGLFVPSGINVITTVVRRPDWQKALSLNELSPHAGMILAPLLVTALRPVLPWRGVFGLLSGLFVVSAVLFAVRVRAGDAHGQAPSGALLRQLARKPAFWLLIVFFALALSGTDGVYLLIPTYLVAEAGIAPNIANTVFGLSRFMPILSLSLAALLSDRFGPRQTMAFALIGSGVAVVLLGLSGGALRLAMVFLQPAIGALYFPAGFAAAASLLPPESRNIGLSMILPVAVVLGVGVLPAAVGYLGEIRSFGLGFVILGAITAVVGATAMLVRFYDERG